RRRQAAREMKTGGKSPPVLASVVLNQNLYTPCRPKVIKVFEVEPSVSRYTALLALSVRTSVRSSTLLVGRYERHSVASEYFVPCAVAQWEPFLSSTCSSRTTPRHLGLSIKVP